MIRLTDKAKERIRFFLQEKSPNDWAVRIRANGPKDFGFSLDEISSVSPLDKVVPADEFKIVFSKTLEEVLQDSTVDYVETAWNRGFKVELKEPEKGNQPELPPLDPADPKTKKIQELLEKEINPAIASHGGVAELVAVKDNLVYLKMGGGCQGCASSQATLRNGIEMRIKEEVPEIIGVVDQTDHAAGVNPFFSAAP